MEAENGHFVEVATLMDRITQPQLSNIFEQSGQVRLKNREGAELTQDILSDMKNRSVLDDFNAWVTWTMRF